MNYIVKQLISAAIPNASNKLCFHIFLVNQCEVRVLYIYVLPNSNLYS